MTDVIVTAVGSDPQAILTQLRQCLGEVVGTQVVCVLDIDLDTRIAQDLGLTSLDVMRLIEAVNQHYPVAERLILWISGLPLSRIRQLTVGDIVGFIANALR